MDAESALLSVMSESEMESEVQGKIDKFHGFLTREVALKLIAKEKGLLKEEEKHIVTTPSAVALPSGLPHCPLAFTRVDKPYMFMTVSLAEDWTVSARLP